MVQKEGLPLEGPHFLLNELAVLSLRTFLVWG
ncbi:MAG: hypothetical protein UY74_C0040G0012 [Candidatus Kaiserbacteria bacterium GW2011_GWC2_52_8b]|uniref:Uncharacterized protein n=1 Tax=Candidatus Kaiserbacteria bacterium GW2011_GWC2_52_8b TaxID=1618676 RepID=A0A0G1XHQ1_9BACT|nr:MAG: hypothetical protein UY74_C0040G0012 [Candidatus Kaiserbacteria bacterium GW2011_GWC2_52_8b]